MYCLYTGPYSRDDRDRVEVLNIALSQHQQDWILPCVTHQPYSHRTSSLLIPHALCYKMSNSIYYRESSSPRRSAFKEHKLHVAFKETGISPTQVRKIGRSQQGTQNPKGKRRWCEKFGACRWIGKDLFKDTSPARCTRTPSTAFWWTIPLRQIFTTHKRESSWMR